MQNSRVATQLISGPSGQLEIEFICHAHAMQQPCHNLAVISHPHPLYGGTMQNKVVSTLFKAYQELGFSVLRYNFRGVGASTGEHDYAQGELADLLAVATWGQQQLPQARLHLAGFSFGSYISLKAAAKLHPASLVTVAPPVGLYDFTAQAIGELESIPQWVLMQGGQDEVVDAEQVLHWARGISRKPDVYWREKATHFFHGELIWLKRALHLAYSSS